jgi:hypothetical protein
MITEDYVSFETAKLTKDYLLADSIQEMDRIINITRIVLNIKNII